MKDFDTQDTFGVDDPPRARRQERVEIEGDPESQAELFNALAKAQGEMSEALKASSHVKFGNYAELQDYNAVIRPAFAKHGLYRLQAPIQGPDNIHRIYLETIIGKGAARVRMVSSAPIMEPNNATNELQCRGIAISYERRYSLAAITGMASSDDNGSAGTEKVPFTEEQIKKLTDASHEGTEAFRAVFKELHSEIAKAWATNVEQRKAWEANTKKADAAKKADKNAA